MEGGRIKGNRRTVPRKFAGDLADPHGMARAVVDHLEYMETRHLSPRTVVSRREHLDQLTTWLEERGVTRPAEVTRPILQRYQRWLFLYRKANGRPLCLQGQFHRLSSVRQLFRWLAREDRISSNPAADIEMPRGERRLPKDVLTESEAETVLAVPDVSTAIGLRDRAMLEVLYATGVRRCELAHLTVWDVDSDRCVLWIRLGKGKKDRVVPLGERALWWVERYLSHARPDLVMEPDEGYLFLNYVGERMGLVSLTRIMREHVKAAGVTKWGSCHLFRHTCATLMLEGGADIRFVQAMLGHALMETTAIYTRVAVGQLSRVHALSHPGAQLRRSRSLLRPLPPAPERPLVSPL